MYNIYIYLLYKMILLYKIVFFIYIIESDFIISPTRHGGEYLYIILYNIDNIQYNV